MNKIAELSDMIVNGNKVTSEDPSEELVMQKCLELYESKLKKENEKILNAASQLEVNADLKNFEKAKEKLFIREKLELEF